MKRTNIYLDDEQARRLRHLAIEEGRSFTDLVREALNEPGERRPGRGSRRADRGLVSPRYRVAGRSPATDVADHQPARARRPA
ncbi:MAG: CopG family transcriptional regulator, partial [Candidatus Dormibacteraceae bacterium]